VQLVSKGSLSAGVQPEHPQEEARRSCPSRQSWSLSHAPLRSAPSQLVLPQLHPQTVSVLLLLQHPHLDQTRRGDEASGLQLLLRLLCASCRCQCPATPLVPGEPGRGRGGSRCEERRRAACRWVPDSPEYFVGGIWCVWGALRGQRQQLGDLSLYLPRDFEGIHGTVLSEGAVGL